MNNYIKNRAFLKSNFSEFKGIKTDKMNGFVIYMAAVGKKQSKSNN